MLPYDVEALRALIETYNRALWPAHLLALSGGVLALLPVVHARAAGRRLVAALLVAVWLWTATGWLAGHYVALNWAGWVYAAMFATQALAMTWSGLVHVWPPPGEDARARLPGVALALVSLLLGPLLDLAYHRSPAALQVVGLMPDATAVFTLGVLASLRGSSRGLTLLPMAWCAWSAWWWWQLREPAHAVLPMLGVAAPLLVGSWRRAR